MSTPTTWFGFVAGPMEQTVVGDEQGTAFWLQTDRGPHPEAARVFVPDSRAAQLDLPVGSGLVVDGVLREDGVLLAEALRTSPAPPDSHGRVLGTVDVHVPHLARLDPARRRRHRLALNGGLAVVVGLGVTAMIWKSSVGGVGFIVFLALCGWLFWDDLRTRSTDDREYTALAADAAAAVRSRLDVDVPARTMFHALGGGLERTGNPWRPTRPRTPRPVSWADRKGGARLMVDVAPKPLLPGAAAIIVVRTVPWDHAGPG